MVGIAVISHGGLCEGILDSVSMSQPRYIQRRIKRNDSEIRYWRWSCSIR